MTYIYSGSRSTNKTHLIILRIKDTIQKGEKFYLVGCKDPQLILNKLKELDINALAEPMIATQPIQAIYTTNGFEGIIDYTGGDKKITGYVFYCNE